MKLILYSDYRRNEQLHTISTLPKVYPINMIRAIVIKVTHTYMPHTEDEHTHTFS